MVMAEAIVKKETRKRKKVSDAERIALELFKNTSKHARQSKMKFETWNGRIIVDDSKLCSHSKGVACTWANNGRPVYCPRAELRFEASLPEREYLTRYSVSCSDCCPKQGHTFHLYCAYCDEILTGSIAGPGGKISDHVVTIRHITKEAEAQHTYFKTKEKLSYEEFHKAATYVSKLERWANTIRFKRKSEERQDFERVLHELQVTLHEVPLPRSRLAPLSSPFLLLPTSRSSLEIGAD